MSRPETIDDVRDRAERIAVVHTDRFASHPALVKAYASFTEAAVKAGGRVVPHDSQRSEVEVMLPLDQAQLYRRLLVEQQEWDSRRRLYDRAVMRNDDGAFPLQDWERERVVEFAEREGLPDPYDTFAARDEELAKLRIKLEENA